MDNKGFVPDNNGGSEKPRGTLSPVKTTEGTPDVKGGGLKSRGIILPAKFVDGNLDADDRREKSCGILSPVKTVEEVPQDVGLKPEIGFVSSIAMVIGSMIGSGIFITPGGVLANVGNVWMSLIMWTLSGLASACGAMCYVELGSVVPSSGAEYAYISEAFGPLPGFMFVWVNMLILQPSSVAIGCLAFAKYFVETFTRDTRNMDTALKLICLGAIFFITYVNYYSVKLSCRIQVFTTCCKLVAFGVVIVGGIYNIAIGNTKYLKFTLEDTRWDFGSLALAFYSGLWAYDGWNQLNYITEEVKNPEKHLPKAIMTGLPLVNLCYIAVNAAFLTVLSPQEFLASSSVATEFGRRFLGRWSFISSLSIALSTFGTAHGRELTSSRLIYVAGREGQIVSFLSFVDMERNTPVVALIFNSFLAILMAVSLDIYALVDFFLFTAWLFYGTAIASLIRLRTTMPNAPRPFKIPIVIPWLMILVSAYVVVVPMTVKPKLEYAYSAAFILFGVAVYLPFVHYKCVMPGTATMTRIVQLTLNVIPPSKFKMSSTSQPVHDKISNSHVMAEGK